MKILGKTKTILEDHDFKEIVSAKIIAITIVSVAGIILSIMTDRLDLVPGLLILLPGFLEMHGNILGSLSARIGTRLHTKEMKPTFRKNKLLKYNIFSSALLMFLVSTFLGLIAYLALLIFFKTSSAEIILISIIAALISTIITIPLTVKMSFWLFKHKHDPDDLMGPYVSSLGDIISILALFIAILVII